MNESIFEYLENDFSQFFGKIHVRYELGEPHKNGTEKRLIHYLGNK